MENVTPIKTYGYDYHCLNCRAVRVVQIPYGTVAESANIKCPNCGVTSEQYHVTIMEIHAQKITTIQEPRR